jgi:tRNA-intron endonuclease
MINAQINKQIISTNSSEAFTLLIKSFFGEKMETKIVYSFPETLYLIETKKMELYSNNKKLSKEEVEKKLSKIDKKFFLKYIVYRDLRKKGYIPKAGLKFGADFRIYAKGKNPNNSHAKWLAFVEHATNKNSWNEFSSKNRVAHSTKKNLLLAVVDEESDVLYFEINWIKP